MYGEGDPFYIKNALQNAKSRGGVLTKVGDGTALFQQAYVGNVAWAHICAVETLRQNASVGGHVYFIADDTPLMNTFDFMDPYLKVKGFCLSDKAVPYSLVYVGLLAAETFAWLVKPVVKIQYPATLCSLIYINKTFYFDDSKSRRKLGYKPIYTAKQAQENTLKYWRSIDV